MTLEKSLSPDLDTLLGDKGAVTRLARGYVSRAQQLGMAQDVLHAITQREHLLVEAGTGTGKTFAYLVPIVEAGITAIVSTATKTLQDQLYYKDLPVVRELTGRQFTSALLKGRSNYLCPERLERNLKVLPRSVDAATVDRLVSVRSWYSRTRTGDITEWLDAESESHLVPLITSTQDNCFGSECPHYDECPLYAARARALEADLVVVNHHLLFADFALGDDNVASLLPAAGAIVLDEAHRVHDIARRFAGTQVGSGQLLELARDVTSEVTLLGSDDPALAQQAQTLEAKTRQLAEAFYRRRRADYETMLADTNVHSAVEEIDLLLSDLMASLDVSGARSRMLASCAGRAMRLADRFALLTETVDHTEYAQWVDAHERGFTIHMTPVSISETFGARVRESNRAWIFTSATLTVDNGFDYVKSSLGLSEVHAVRYDSPFDYQNQVIAFVPPVSGIPGSDEHTLSLLCEVAPVIRHTRGRSFVLFTSYRALNLAASWFSNQSDMPFLVQGQKPRSELLARFREIERCVLLATHSFWEGVDVRGAELRLVVIDKLPFSSPEDPLTRAQVTAIDESGGNGFREHMIPEAAITLRQGFGRLIREERDRGVFVLGDPRVHQKSYGKSFIASLPKMPWAADVAAVNAFLDAINEPDGATLP